MLAGDDDNHRSRGGGDAGQGKLALEVFTPQIVPGGDRSLDLGGVVNDADATDSIGWAIIALRRFADVVNASEVGSLARSTGWNRPSSMPICE
jgi:hypothetical protein